MTARYLLVSGKSKSCGCYHQERVSETGPRAVRYQGRRWKDRDGYVSLTAPDPTYWSASGKRTVLEHRLVMERILGRRLRSEESVHHRNGVRDDNRPENLELWWTAQPSGQRVEDLICYWIEFLIAQGYVVTKREGS